MKRLFIIAFTFALYSCSSMKKPIETSTPSAMIEATIGTTSLTGDPFDINAIWIEGNVMHLSISYSGGCGEHTFQCIGSPQISKSLPPKRSISVIHTNHEDFCKKRITDTLKINIEALAYKQEDGSEIILNVVNWNSPLLYRFTKTK
jgi:hypothetical protein